MSPVREPITILAVAYGTNPIAESTPDGIVVYDERFDRDSVAADQKPVRILAHHKADQVLGRVERWEVTPEGLVAHGYVTGSASQREQVRALIEDGLVAEASVGFKPGKEDVWARPTTRGGLPLVTRKGVRLTELSIVPTGAVKGSRVLSLAPSTPVSAPQASGPPVEAQAVLAEAQAAIAGAPGSYAATAREAWEAAQAEAVAEVTRAADRQTAREAEHRDRVLAEARALIEKGQAFAAARPYARLSHVDLAARSRALQDEQEWARRDGVPVEPWVLRDLAAVRDEQERRARE